TLLTFAIIASFQAGYNCKCQKSLGNRISESYLARWRIQVVDSDSKNPKIACFTNLTLFSYNFYILMISLT
ncbi:hypothetical protein J4429_05055, partial [Candidatus Pacearchaeota archaeon]|nr:hypothetical protein [Candidatus Pacearchaeota archaeon]